MKEKKHEHEHKEHGHDHHEHEHLESSEDDFNIEKDFDNLALEEVVYGNQHILNILLDILIEKGLVSEQEFKDKLDQMVVESQDIDQVRFDIPEDEDK